MPWIYLFTAGIFEIVWVIAMKYSDGFSKIVPSAITLVGMVASVVFLGLAAKTIPLGTSYAVWTGIGAVGAVIAGIMLFGEPAGLIRMFFVSLVVIGIIGLKMSSVSH